MNDAPSIISRYVEPLVGLIYPRQCGSCGGGLTGAERFFCEGCLSAVSRIKGPLCGVCGKPFPSGAGFDHPCSDCLKKPPPYDMARAAVVYEGAVKEAVKLYKYRPFRTLGGYLGGFVHDCAPVWFGSATVVTAVPLHKRRLMDRGFNQSIILAERAAASIGARLSLDGLKRTRHTTPQVRVDHSAREANVRGAFAVTRPGEFEGEHVLVVDDVYTTGATVKECARALKRAGASGVFVLTVARAV
jgi:ComF family protein